MFLFTKTLTTLYFQKISIINLKSLLGYHLIKTSEKLWIKPHKKRMHLSTSCIRNLFIRMIRRNFQIHYQYIYSSFFPWQYICILQKTLLDYSFKPFYKQDLLISLEINAMKMFFMHSVVMKTCIDFWYFSFYSGLLWSSPLILFLTLPHIL